MLHEKGLREVARKIARDGLMREQSACSSTHVVMWKARETPAR